MSLKKDIAAYLATFHEGAEQQRYHLENFARWVDSRRPKSVPTLDQLARRAEFERLFKLIPKEEGPMLTAALVCGVSVQTVRIWRCESAHRFPSWEHINKLEDRIKEFKK